MQSAQEVVTEYFPHRLQEFAISALNFRNSRMRTSGAYQSHLALHSRLYFASKDELYSYQAQRFRTFVRNATLTSSFFGEGIGRGAEVSIDEIRQLPVLEKADLVRNFDSILSSAVSSPVVSKTGGTTGASLKVVFEKADFQERIAILNLFREQFGYRPGAPVAWLSGKAILSSRDRRAGRFCKRDRFTNTLFVSTFDIGPESVESIIRSLEQFGTKYLVGFPSSMGELARYATAAGLSDRLRSLGVVACFPTSETITPDIRLSLESAFGLRVADQYASAEGAPFITECIDGRLHSNPMSGVFEVIDNEGEPADIGSMLVTSFATSATPLIRYRIGDSMEWEDPDLACTCGQNTRIVKQILGRDDDYALTVDGRRVNLGNLSNCTKGVGGLVKFKLIQTSPTNGRALVETTSDFGPADSELLRRNLVHRLGDGYKVDVEQVDRIERADSGKFRIVERTFSS